MHHRAIESFCVNQACYNKVNSLLFLFIFNFFEKRRLDLIVDNGLPDANFKRRCSWFDVADVDAALRREEDLVIVAQRVDADVELFGLTKLLFHWKFDYSKIFRDGKNVSRVIWDQLVLH